MDRHHENPAALALAKLRTRSGLTMEKLAKAAGYKTASGIQRYETPTDRSAKYINMDVVEKLAKALVGRGNPTITEIEVFSDLAGGLPLRLVGLAGPTTLQVTSSKPTPLPEGSNGLGLYDEGGRLLIRLKLSRKAIRDIREDFVVLESGLPSE